MTVENNRYFTCPKGVYHDDRRATNSKPRL